MKFSQELYSITLRTNEMVTFLTLPIKKEHLCNYMLQLHLSFAAGYFAVPYVALKPVFVSPYWPGFVSHRRD